MLQDCTINDANRLLMITQHQYIMSNFMFQFIKKIIELRFKYDSLHFKNRVHPIEQLYIIQIDGSFFHGGLCDRLKGIISLYAYCKQNRLNFKINHTYPFPLFEYLLPNEYDWLLEPTQISHNIFETKILNMIGKQTIKQLTKLNTRKQIHIYANTDYIKEINYRYSNHYEWGSLFKELFTLEPKLKNLILKHKNNIKGNYIAIHLRFQNLLGDDFTELGAPFILLEQQQNILIEQCTIKIQELISKYNYPITAFIASDSNIFLNTIKGLENTYIIHEKIIHIDNQTPEKSSEITKLFVDFFLISEAAQIYAIGSDLMYPSAFPLYASMLNNVPFQRVSVQMPNQSRIN